MKNNDNKKPFFTVRRMAQLGILTAIILVMGMTPIGYIHIPGLGLEITLIVIPVALGAILLGPLSGLFLGAVFGLTSFYQCFTPMSPFGATLLSINPILTFLVCFPTRTLMGFLTGLSYHLVVKHAKSEGGKVGTHIMANVLGALMNTLFFMTALCLCFYNTEYIQSIKEGLNAKNPLMFVIYFVGINGLVEAICAIVIGSAISYPLEKVLRRIGLLDR